MDDKFNCCGNCEPSGKDTIKVVLYVNGHVAYRTRADELKEVLGLAASKQLCKHYGNLSPLKSGGVIIKAESSVV